MRLNKEEIYNYLFDCQKQFGGYTGKDIEKISHSTGFDRRTVKRSVEEWSRTDIRFAELKYISKRSISVTLEDIAILNQHLKKNITIRKQRIIREINEARIKRGDFPIPKTTLYLLINKQIKELTNGAPEEMHWLITQGIKASDTYNLADARTTLSDTFIYSGLKIFGGIDIDGIALRLQDAQKRFQETYPSADPFKWFFRIRPRSKVIRNHLSKIHADESLPNQARLLFEAQADFIVRLNDILIDELIHREGWIQYATLYVHLLRNMLNNNFWNILFAVWKFSLNLKIFQQQPAAKTIIIILADRIDQIYFFITKCPIINKFCWFPMLSHMLILQRKLKKATIISMAPGDTNVCTGPIRYE